MGAEMSACQFAAALVFLHGSSCSTRAIAAIVTRDRLGIFAEFFQNFLARNGAGYGIPLFGSLPAQTINYAPDLIRAEVVLEGYLKWIEWAEGSGADPWAQIEARVLERVSVVANGQRSAGIARHRSRSADSPQELARRARGHCRGQATGGRRRPVPTCPEGSYRVCFGP